MLLGSVSFMMGTFYMAGTLSASGVRCFLSQVNHSDREMKIYTWKVQNPVRMGAPSNAFKCRADLQVICATISIFVAVLMYQAAPKTGATEDACIRQGLQ